MKKILFIGVTLSLLIALAGCSSTHPQSDTVSKVSANNNTTTVTKQNWYVTKQNYNGTLFSYTVNLQISGTTSASSVTVTTSGNGLITEKPIAVVNGAFSKNVVVGFYMLSSMNINPNYSTSVNLVSHFKDNTTRTDVIKSPILDFSNAQTVRS